MQRMWHHLIPPALTSLNIVIISLILYLLHDVDLFWAQVTVYG